MNARYVPIHAVQFEALMREMGFTGRLVGGKINEYAYERQLEYKGRMLPAKLVIWSSIKPNQVSASCGNDAIRFVLISTTTNKPIHGKLPRVYRTENALSNTRAKAREAWKIGVRKFLQKKC